MTVSELIDATLDRINREYQAGALPWIKANRPDEWGKMLTLEGKTNFMALCDNIEGLRKALDEYQGVILAMVKEFKPLKEKKGQGMFNFRTGKIL